VTAFTFSIEQLRSAPPEVRRWFAGEIGRALGGVEGPRPEMPRHPEPTTLAACTAAEALQIFELIGNDAIATRLFFELARETLVGSSLPGVHALRMADLLHHVGLPGQDSLIAGLAMIDRAFRQIHGEHAGSLFGFDDAGHIYLHETTQLSIRRVWEELVQAHAAEPEAAPEAAPRGEGFVAPRVGPSEDVATHAARPLPGRDRPF
jgi:hypothetical protein